MGSRIPRNGGMIACFNLRRAGESLTLAWTFSRSGVMARTWLIGVLALVGLVLSSASSLAQRDAEVHKNAVRISPLPERVAMAEIIVTGRVTAIEEKKFEARPYPGLDEKVEFTIAVVQIDDALLKAKGITHVKIGFVELQPGGASRGPVDRINLNKDQEGCFLLRPHFEESFLTAPAKEYIIHKKDNSSYETELESVKCCTKLLADSNAGLNAKSADDRFLTAALLLTRYRLAFGRDREEKVDAKESKLILHGLVGGDWSKGFSTTEITPMMAFGRLALTEKDGWKLGPVGAREKGTPEAPKEFPDAAKKWLKDYADSYSLKRFVATKKEKKD
jgi:hypothetical protein